MTEERISHLPAGGLVDLHFDLPLSLFFAGRGVIGINAILVSAEKEEATLDRYIDHIEHVPSQIGIDGVGIQFDFCESLWRQMPVTRREELDSRLRRPHFLPDLGNHGQARNLTRKLIERGFNDEQIENFCVRTGCAFCNKFCSALTVVVITQRDVLPLLPSVTVWEGTKGFRGGSI